MDEPDGRSEFQRIVDGGLVAILRGVDPDAVVETVEAPRAGGVGTVEITADSPGAIEMISAVSEAFSGEMLVGAGTVLDAATARAALLAGARFLVSPSVHEDVVRAANRYGAPVAPGAMTPTEAVRAAEAGADLVKVFPASTLGPEHVAALGGPLGQIPLVPTGGVDLDNVAAFFEAGAAAVGVGSALVDDGAVDAGDYEAVTESARAFTDAIAGARDK
jgi:2-dehydro-3-deoxyphosphogluconate aldolase/(4S)-4-hydroxy-2-oxoglutarate aldolase